MTQQNITNPFLEIKDKSRTDTKKETKNKVIKMNVDELKEEMDIEDEMNEEEEDSDTDSDLLIQALRDRIRAAAYLQALGHKLPFGLHFGLIHSLPQAQEALKKAHEESERKLKGSQLPFVCSEKNCGAKFSSWSLLSVHLNVHRLASKHEKVSTVTIRILGILIPDTFEV